MHKILILSAIFLFLFSCNQEEVDNLSSQNQELKGDVREKNKEINQLLGTFNSIQENINEIKKREGVLKVKTGENNTEYDIDHINQDIELISDLMKKNENLMEDLQRQIDQSKSENKELLRLLGNLKEQLNMKNQEIAALNSALREKKIKIGQLYFSVDSLSYANKLKEQKLKKTSEQLYEAYYAYGTFKELREENVVTKEGGVLGLGRTESLKDDFNKDYFSKIDIREQTSFLIYAKKAEVLTNHPKDSYEFRGDGDQIDSLTILDPEAFWAASNYLVIVIE
mgnify:CR=1 FL=1